MSNPEHLAILKQGVAAWNVWRADKPYLEPDLRELNMYGAQLANVELDEAILDGANLKTADLSSSNLSNASLVGANLYKAKLTFASLRYTILPNATLKETELFAATLQSAALEGADLSRARLGDTVITNTDLSRVIGLDSVTHEAPSFIDIATLYRSKGKIPEVFLRGCGVPEDFITYARSLVTNPIEYYSCFISYSSKDSAFANRLHAELQAKAIRCWYAPEDLRIGEKFRTTIEESIRIYDKVMVVLSENSIQSAWVEEEVEAALERERQHPDSLVLFPIRLDDAVMETKQAWAASLRRIRQIGDFSKWKNHDSYQKAFERLLRDLKSQTKAASAK